MPTWGQVSREGILHTRSDWHAGGYTPVPLQPRRSWGGNILDIRIWRPHKMSPLMSKNTQIPRWGRPKHRLVRPVNQALEKTKTVYEKLGFCNNLTLPEEKRKKVLWYLLIHLVENSQLFGLVTAVKRIVAIVPICHNSPTNKCRPLFLNCRFSKWPSWTNTDKKKLWKTCKFIFLKMAQPCNSLNAGIVHSLDDKVYLIAKWFWKLKVFKL